MVADTKIPQPGILAPLPPFGRYLSFSLHDPDNARSALTAMQPLADGLGLVVGAGANLVLSVGASIPGLRNAQAHSGRGVVVPSTPVALWCWLRGDGLGELFNRSVALESVLSPVFRLDSAVDAFVHDGGRDLTGYEDGTENPKGDDARVAAIIADHDGLCGSSFVAVQQWEHDMAKFHAIPGEARDNMVGRRRSDNEELADAPASAHVKRTAQESFSPEAFVLRRSMPWVEGNRGGLMFVAFGRSFDAFEAQLNRMVGGEDGIADDLFRFTRPVTSAYFWCPAMRNGRLDLRLLGL